MEPKIIKPVEDKYPLTFDFGESPEWYLKVFGYPHNGLDFGCPVDTTVKACDYGVVTYSDDVPDSDGKGIIISHEWGISLYWHLNRINAMLGAKVDKGSTIGYSGNTGYCTGPHLHFGIKVFGVDVQNMRGWCDPKRYFAPEIANPTTPTAFNRMHRVGIGESLYSIALKYYGNGLEWRRIWDANRDKIKNPNLIYPLQNLLIP